MKILVTGGAGFIGGHIASDLLKEGHKVVIFDNLEYPTHIGNVPSYITKDAKFILGDIRHKNHLLKALKDVDVIYHQAATGGFSTDIARYIETNSLGTAMMMELIIKNKIPIKKIIVASSVAVYGEGKYKCPKHGYFYPAPRSLKHLTRADWNIKCLECGKDVIPCLTDETSPVSLNTPYALSKFDEERLVLSIGKQNDIPCVALRYFLTYGPGQSLLNPYTGVCSIFYTRILNNKPPIIYEDGLQMRDFIFVEDVVKANLLVLKDKRANYEVFNVGSGKGITIRELANKLIEISGKKMGSYISKQFRIGDVRNIIADITKIQKLGFKPDVDLGKGLRIFIEWISTQSKVSERFSKAFSKLQREGLIRKTK